MICSQCGTNNAKTSKYCRECGKRLIVEELELQHGIAAEPTDTPDDKAVSELLYETLKLYERGNLEGAFQKCRLALGINPASTSARSLLALIYERKAEDQAAAGYPEDAEDYLTAAIRQVERVLEANPDSIADQEKLQTLKSRLSSPVPLRPQVKLLDRARTAFRRIPVPIAASVGTALVVFLLVMIVISAASRKKADDLHQPVKFDSRASQPLPTVQQPAAPPPSPYPTAGTAPTAGYPPQAQAPQPTQGYPQYPQQTQPSQPAQPRQRPLQPVNPLPEAPGPASPRIQPPSVLLPVEPAPRPQTPPRSVVDDARQAMRAGEYASAVSLYQEAIANGADTGENSQALGMCYSNLGKSQEAARQFEHAIELYKVRAAAGDASAEKGIRTCNAYINVIYGR